MQSIKPGRGPSAMGAIGGVIAVAFGIFWTVMAFTMTREAPAPVHIFFPLFGVMFVVAGIANVAYNFYNTTNKQRLSAFDITTTQEESDPLNEMFGAKQKNNNRIESIESKLQELDGLRSKGLVSDSEYASQRQRILNSI